MNFNYELRVYLREEKGACGIGYVTGENRGVACLAVFGVGMETQCEGRRSGYPCYGKCLGDARMQCLLWMSKCSEAAIVATQSAPCKCITITTARHNVPTVKLDGSDRTVMTTQVLHTKGKKTIYKKKFINESQH